VFFGRYCVDFAILVWVRIEQFFLSAQTDETHNVMPRVDPQTGTDIRDYAENLGGCVAFTDVAGEKSPAKLRKRIVDPYIKGPIETGWVQPITP
jgi:hypothetical protein